MAEQKECERCGKKRTLHTVKFGQRSKRLCGACVGVNTGREMDLRDALRRREQA